MLGEFVISGVYLGFLTQLVPSKALEWFSEPRFVLAGVIVKQFASGKARGKFPDLWCWPATVVLCQPREGSLVPFSV